ncbi:MAG: hypothetical protein OXG88_09720 [Gammaproteobacteria bacterium]|nr:hypothetical protein [Gammaproteobacteria bacterium]
MEFAEFGLASLVIIVVMAAMSGGLILYGYHLNRRESQAQLQTFRPLNTSVQEGLFDTVTSSDLKDDRSTKRTKLKFEHGQKKKQPVKQRIPTSTAPAVPVKKDMIKAEQPTPVQKTDTVRTALDGTTERTIFDALISNGKMPTEGIIKHVVRKKVDPHEATVSRPVSEKTKDTVALQPQTSTAIDNTKETKTAATTVEVSQSETAKSKIVTPIVASAPHQQSSDSGEEGVERNPLKSDRSNLSAIRTPPKPSVRNEQQKTKIANVDERVLTPSPTIQKNVEAESDEFVILTVMGDHETAFNVSELAKYLLARGLTYDKLKLFCKTDTQTGRGLFKVADAFAPGHFNVDPEAVHQTKGVTFVMWLSKVINPQSTFELMFGLASDCAARFNAIVQDESGNKLSKQTISHYRSRIADFRRKQMTM